MEATEVTGRAIFGPWPVDPGLTETPDGIRVGEGFVFLHGWDTNDPRLNGEMFRTVNFRLDADSNVIESVAYELTNDGGSWVGDGRGYSLGEDGSGFVALSGRGGYEGLTAFLVHEGVAGEDGWWSLKGVIYPSAMPEIPAPWAGE